MGNTRIGDLSTFTGDASGSFLVMNNADNTATFKITRETLLADATASYALTASYVSSTVTAETPFLIATGSITASVSDDISNLFLIKSGSTSYLNIAKNSNTTLFSNLFIIKNFTNQQPVLTVSQSLVQFATQSFDPSGNALNGGIWFTSASMYVGLD